MPEPRSFADLYSDAARTAGDDDAATTRAAARAALEERVALWSLLEVAGCAAAHAFPVCSEAPHGCIEEGWRSPPPQGSEGDATEVGLQLALALDAVGRRGDALSALRRARSRRPDCARVRLALAKLLFRSSRKSDAAAELAPLLNAARGVGVMTLPSHLAGDSFYIAGWVLIHADDHTAAYSLWCEGATLFPTDARLIRQQRKVAVWALEHASLDHTHLPPSSSSPLLFEGDYLPHTLHATEYVLHPSHPPEPALSLFHDASQCRRVAFTSVAPLLTPSECGAVLAIVESHILQAHSGTWPTVRRASVPTTDIAVEDVPPLIPWLRALLSQRLYPFCARSFPILADGSHVTPCRLRVHDAFIVRYDAALGSLSLPEHSDTSAISVTVALNDPDADFEGGHLFISALAGSLGGGGVVPTPLGHATAFAGPLRHGGAPITRGVRVVLVLFLYIDGFAYGQLLEGAKAVAPPARGGTDRGGHSFVVYRETKELVEALEASDVDHATTV